MPVGVLLCEGGPRSPDIRLLSVIAGTTVEAYGSKYGMGDAIKAWRSLPQAPVVAGIRDRDFEREFRTPSGAPEHWQVAENDRQLWLGWYWERVEIENYLIDPEVVRRALGPRGPDPTEYRAALEHSARSLSAYTAARIALSRSRVRFSPLPCSWGLARGKYGHRLPDERTAAECRRQMSVIVDEYAAGAVVKKSNVRSRFRDVLSECRPGGARFQDPLTFFSGKDLLWAMEVMLARLGIMSPGDLLARVLNGIEGSAENVWTWLPEWQRLRAAIAAVNDNGGP